METSMTHVLREKIKTSIKNGIDISNLIENVCIKNEDLSNAIIKKFVRKDTNISGCNFSSVIFGDKDSSSVDVMILKTNLQNCNFQGAIFKGRAFMRSCDARNCNFKSADVSNIDYQYTNFEGCTFCESVIKISTRSGIGCKFPKEVFEDLTKGWDMNIEIKSKEK